MKRNLRAPNTTAARVRGGYVIFAVLIVVVVLSLVAYRFTESMTAEYRASARAADDAQAKAAAASGLHYAAAVLADRETFDGELDGNPFDNPTIFEQFEVATSGTGGKRAFFSIRSVALADGGGYEQRFGATDEGGKLNINSMIQLDQTGEALYNALMKLPNMSPDVADAIVDWVDADEVKRPAGAENGEYGSLPSPYKAKNGPLNSLDELLLVQGVTPEMLYGGDTNRNGVFDDGEPGTDRGWSDYLTVYGRELNVDRDGTVRTYLNIPDLTVLGQQLTNSVGEELATYILACRLFRVTKTDESGNVPGATTTASFTTGSNGSVALNLSSTTTARPTRAATLDELKAAVEAKKAATLVSLPGRLQSQMDFAYSRIALPRPPDAPQDAPDVVAYSPLLDATKRAALFALLLDKTTIKQAVELVPRINVNTAPREVLMGLTAITNAANEPLMTEADVDAILAERADQAPDDPATTSCAWLITAASIPPATYRRMEKYVTGSTMVYRVQSIGFLANGGPVARMEAVIDTNQGAPRFLHVRDLTDLENPRGFEPPKVTDQ